MIARPGSGWLSSYPKSLPLRLKVIAATTLVLLGIAVILALTVVRFQRFYLQQEADKRARSLATHLAVNSRDPLLMDDLLRLATITQSVLEDPDTRYAFVVDHEGAIAYHSNTQLIGTHVRDLAELAAFDPASMLEAAVPIVVENATVGVAHVGLDEAFIDEALAATTRGLLGRLGLGLAAGLALLLVLTEVHVRRIERLTAAVTALRAGDLRARAEVGGRDEVAQLADHFNATVEELRAARAEIERGVTTTVRALASTIEANDAYTHGHCRRVGLGTRALAQKLDLDPEAIQEFELAAVLHDIGKIGVSTEVLSKRQALTETETLEMQQHSEIGARILGSVSFLTDVAQHVRSHHENWDGSGYPDGLAGEETSLGARIVHVVDAFDAMTSGRPYRDPMGADEALRRLLQERKRQFDPQLVERFCELVDDGTIAAIRRRLDGEVVT